MSSNTEQFCTRRTVIACLAVGALLAVSSDASADPLTETDYAAFAAGPIKYVVGSPLNTRIPQGTTSPGFRLAFSKVSATTTEVTSTGEVYVPAHTYTTLQRKNGDGPWEEVSKQYPGGFTPFSTRKLMQTGAETVVLPLTGGPTCEITLVLNTASSPKSVLVTVTHVQSQFTPFNPQSPTMPPAQTSGATKKQRGGACVYTRRPHRAGA